MTDIDLKNNELYDENSSKSKDLKNVHTPNDATVFAYQGGTP